MNKIMEEDYVKQLQEQLASFVEAMATAIDERTPYNGNHTRKVAYYSVILAKKINEKYKEGKIEQFFDENRIEKLRLAALLHDIGKMVISKKIMNRASRMDGDMERIIMRFELIQSWYYIDFLEGRILENEYEAYRKELHDILKFIHEVDCLEYLDDDKFLEVQRLRGKVYQKHDGQKVHYLTEEEIAHLSIRKGTLTDKERQLMQSHVEMTAKILSKVKFTENYSDVPVWTASHHEFLDGSGYPNHLTAADLSIETRIITIADIYDALTATDRPYKKPMSMEDAFSVMNGMACAGKIDGRLVKWLLEALSCADV